MITGYIYKITNKIDGKAYIGQTIRSVSQRFKEHLNSASNSSYLKRALLKHGIDNFEISTLMTAQAESKRDLVKILNSLEDGLIKSLNTVRPSGYNGMGGGTNSADRQWNKPKSLGAVRKSAINHQKPVICVETGQTWPSVASCAAYFKVKPKQISRVLMKQRKRLKWLYTLIYFVPDNLIWDALKGAP